jgi:hypothetical protein
MPRLPLGENAARNALDLGRVHLVGARGALDWLAHLERPSWHRCICITRSPPLLTPAAKTGQSRADAT